MQMEEFARPERGRLWIKELLRGAGVLALLVILMVWLAGGFVHKVARGIPSEPEKAGNVSTRKVERRTFTLYSEQVGTVRSHTEAGVSSRIMAQVKEISVREGDLVWGTDAPGGKATLLARLDDGDIRARLRQAQAQITAMQRAEESSGAKMKAAAAMVDAAGAERRKTDADFKRIEGLHREEVVSTQQLDHYRAQRDVAGAQTQARSREVSAAKGDMERVRAQREQAEAVAAEMRVMLGFTEIRAPFSGRVVKKMLNVGDMATPGSPVFLMETASRPEFHVNVSESVLPKVKTGEELEVKIDALARSFPGKVSEIVPQSDASTRTVLVKVSLEPSDDLVNGLFGRMGIPVGSYPALVVPLDAVREVGQLELVDVLDPDGVSRRRFVRLGEVHGDVVEVLSGLGEGEAVIVP